MYKNLIKKNFGQSSFFFLSTRHLFDRTATLKIWICKSYLWRREWLQFRIRWWNSWCKILVETIQSVVRFNYSNYGSWLSLLLQCWILLKVLNTHYGLTSKNTKMYCFGHSRSVTRKNCQMSIKVGQKWFHKKNDRFWHI